MLEAFEANETEKKIRQQSINTKLTNDNVKSNLNGKLDGGINFQQFANGYLENTGFNQVSKSVQISPRAQQDYIINKMNEQKIQLEED